MKSCGRRNISEILHFGKKFCRFKRSILRCNRRLAPGPSLGLMEPKWIFQKWKPIFFITDYYFGHFFLPKHVGGFGSECKFGPQWPRYFFWLETCLRIPDACSGWFCFSGWYIMGFIQAPIYSGSHRAHTGIRAESGPR